MTVSELCAHGRPPARGLPSAIRSMINRKAHALALEFEKQERDRLRRAYLENGQLPDDLLD